MFHLIEKNARNVDSGVILDSGTQPEMITRLDEKNKRNLYVISEQALRRLYVVDVDGKTLVDRKSLH